MEGKKRKTKTTNNERQETIKKQKEKIMTKLKIEKTNKNMKIKNN